LTKKNIIVWILRLALAVMYLMMAIPKFGGQEITVLIFTQLGVEPWGRIATGVVELVTFILVIAPITTIYGILLSLVVISGAIVSHVAILGFVIENSSGSVSDGGEVFMTALIILALTFVNLYLHRESIPLRGKEK